MKYALAIPIYRYAQYMNQRGFKITEVDLYNYVKRTAQVLEPIYNKLLSDLFKNKANVIHVDETTLEVIDSNKAKCYMFVYTTSFWDNPIYIYEFNETRKTDKLKEHLQGYKGYLVTDGYSGYNSFSRIQRCFVHVRRYFNDRLKVLNSEEQKKSKEKENQRNIRRQ